MNTFLFTPVRDGDGYYRIPMNSITCDKEWFHHPDLASGSLLYLVDQLNSCLCMAGDWSVEGDHIRLNTDVTGVIRMPFRVSSPFPIEDGPSTDIIALFDARNAARHAKDFKRADSIRDELKNRGWEIKDSKTGPKLSRIKP